MSRALATADGEEQALRHLAAQVGHFLAADVFFVARLEQEKGPVAFDLLLADGEVQPRRLLDARGGVTRLVVGSGRPLLLRAAADWAKLAGDEMVAPGVKMLGSLATAPLWDGHRCAGALCALSRQPDAYSPAHVELLTALGNALAAALQGQRLRALHEQRTHDLALFCRGAQLIADTLDVPQVLGQLARYVADLLDADATTIRLLDRSTDELVVRASFVREAGMRTRLRRAFTHPVRPGQGVAGTVFVSRQPALIPDIGASSRLLPPYRDAYGGTGSQAAVLLHVGQEPLGTLLVHRADSARPLTAQDLPLITGLADLASIAIRNADLYAAALAAKGNLAAIINSMAEGVLVYDRAGSVLLANPVIYQIFDLDPAQIRLEGLPGRKLAALVVGVLAQPEQAAAVLYLAEEEPRSVQPIQFEVQRPERRILQSVAAPVRDEEGEPLGQLVLLRDITRESEAQRAKDEFVSVLSHELRTPLTSIKGYAQLLARRLGDIQAVDRKALEVIDGQTNNMLRLVEDLLSIAQLAKGRLFLLRVPLQLGELAREAVDALPYPHMGRRIHLQVEEGLPLVRGDHNRLLGVLVHLLANALKYSPGGTIEVDVRAADGEVAVAVHDEGIGIAPDQQERIFAPFYQVDSSTTRRFGGVGLGLFVSKGIVEAHGGRIWVESTLGRGSTFGFAVPVSKEQPGRNQVEQGREDIHERRFER